MGRKRWWEERSAADDGDDPEEGVAVDDEEEDWIDRFKFSDYRADRGLSSTDAIWNRYGYSGSSFWDNSRTYRSSTVGTVLSNRGADFATAKRIEAAQRLVQGFVDTFALDNPLRARFAEGSSIGDEDGTKNVVVSHRPLLDPTLDVSDAHRIMTAQAANAAAHARYGGKDSIIRKAMVNMTGPVARDLAEILDGYRIDETFRHDYPGYSDVYAPAQRYIAKGLLDGRESFDLEDFRGASIANAALNFGEYTNWTGREEERDWWTNWAATYAFGDPYAFAKGVQKAVEHLNLPIPPKPPTNPDQPKDDDDENKSDDDEKREGGGGGEGGDESDDEQEGKGGQGKGDDEEESGGAGSGDDEQDHDEQQDEQQDAGWGEQQDAGLGDDDESDGQGSGPDVNIPVGLGRGVTLTGLANGQSTTIDEIGADEVAEAAKALDTGLNDKEVGEVYWTANGFHGGVTFKVKAESVANGYIRRAFTRSRTAHYATERGHVTGRIDNRSLPRIASDDYRLFSKRTAPSETRYRVWLLIDNSGSMGQGGAKIASDLAASVALAVRHVPNVTLDVWAWTSGIKLPGAEFSAVRVYADGDPIAKIGAVGQLPQGGTPDNSVLSWATKAIRKQCRPDETPVILMASDGHGGLMSEVWQRDPEVRERYFDKGVEIADDRVLTARKAGIKVMSVAIGSGLNEDSQKQIYGKGNYLKWEGSIKKMAKPLGDLLARVASNRA